jgi:RNA polymerase sigma factor (TIGR02999 family)
LPGCWQDRAHFYAVAAITMRRILVEHARHRGAAKRGAGRRALPLAAALGARVERRPELVALDDCLAALAAVSPLQAAVVELRFFGGFSLAETALAVGRSRATVIRQWRLARAWLRHELSGAPGRAGARR